MSKTKTSIRLDTKLADEGMKVIEAKPGSKAIDIALREIVAVKRFKNLMKKNAGKLSFSNHLDWCR